MRRGELVALFGASGAGKSTLTRLALRLFDPDSGAVRPEPRVSVAFGTPEASGEEIALPVRIGGTEYLGAAMLTLEATLDRYEVTGFDVSPPGNWLTSDVGNPSVVASSPFEGEF